MSVIDRSAEVEVFADRRNVTVHVLTDITVTNSKQICAAVESAWEEKRRPRRLILDLTGVQHLDSSGIGALMEIQRRMTNANTALVLTGLEEPPRRLLERTGISRLFDIRGGANDTAIMLPASRRSQERVRDDRIEDAPKRRRHRALWALLWFCLIVGGLTAIGASAYPTLQNYRAQLDRVPVLSGVLHSMDQRVQSMEQAWKDHLGKLEARLDGHVRASRKQAEDLDRRAAGLKSQLDDLESAQRATDARVADLEEQAQRNTSKEGPQQ